MATAFSVKFNLDAVLAQLATQLPQRVAVGAARAINRTAASERTALSSDIAGDMGIRVGTARDAMTVNKATASNPTAQVVCKGARLPLIEFNARGPEPSRGRGGGVSYSNPGAGGTQRIANAFIATMPGGGHRGVFVRKGQQRSRKGLPAHSPGLPIREPMGPSIVKSFEKMVPAGEARRTDSLVKNLEHEISFALSQGA